MVISDLDVVGGCQFLLAFHLFRSTFLDVLPSFIPSTHEEPRSCKQDVLPFLLAAVTVSEDMFLLVREANSIYIENTVLSRFKMSSISLEEAY